VIEVSVLADSYQSKEVKNNFLLFWFEPISFLSVRDTQTVVRRERG
tara:strand:+ start:229 stop:366 length:138 start_codon:yes stop_codon:yes gene_type:complete